MTHLYDLAEELGVRVEHGDLTKWKIRGYYDWQNNLIWLQHDLNPVLERCTLAHELGHAHYGDTASANRLHHAKVEQRADQFAANLLINFDDYKDAETSTAGTLGALARQLDVTTDIVTAYQQQLLRLGATVYLGARNGGSRVKTTIV